MWPSLFAEEGINGAHQDPQYNVLYRDINCVRSFVDACESKSIMAWAGMLQIDGAHNANATAREAWKVMPELIVQHAINSLFSERVGMKPENISLSTVPPTATPAPCVYTDLLRRGAAGHLRALQDAGPAEHEVHLLLHPRGDSDPCAEHAHFKADQRGHPVHHHP